MRANGRIRIYCPFWSKSKLDGHLHLDGRVRVVADHLEIFKHKVVNVGLGRVDSERGEVSRFPLELLAQSIGMIQVHVCVANGVDEIAGLPSRSLCHQVRQQCVRRNVERDAQSKVGRSLVHLTRHLVPVCVDVELTEHVARWECHQVQIGRIPRRQDNAAIFRIVLNFVNAFAQLIHPLTGVVGVHINILGTKVAPLEPVHWPQVAHLPVRQAATVEEFARPVPVPNVHTLVRQQVGIGAALRFVAGQQKKGRE